MAKKNTKDNFMTPVRHTAATRAEVSKKVAQDIAREEAAVRDEKTAKLRKARLEMETRQTEGGPDGD